MNRLLWGIAFLVMAAGGWAQSTWRGQAEVWAVASAPVEGFVVASNEFPRNSLLTVENYKTKKTIQVRVVAALPAGSSALVLLNAKAAQALEIKAGETPLVGVRLDPNGVERPDNPDPDVNPLAAPAVALAPEVPAPAPVPVPAPAADKLMPLPALAPPAPVPEPAPVAEPEPTRTPLAVADEPEPSTPVTPGKKVFLTTRESAPVATETPAVTEPTESAPEPATKVSPTPPVAVVEAPAEPPAPVETPTPAVPNTPVRIGENPAPVAPVVAQTPVEIPSPPALPASPPPVAVPEPMAVPAPVATLPDLAPVPVAVKPGTAWVAVPAKLQGPVLGQVAVLAGLEKGRPYVQLGSWATEADLLKALDTVKSYVPLALYQAEGEKYPWRVVAAAPKGQLGVLLMLFKSEGFRTAAVVKG